MVTQVAAEWRQDAERLCRDPAAAARRARAGGAGVVGLVGGGIPAEVVRAAGMVPLELHPAWLAPWSGGELAAAPAGGERPASRPEPRPARGREGGLRLAAPAAEVYAALSEGRLGFLDGLVVGRASEAFVRLFHVLREHKRNGVPPLPPLHFHDHVVTASQAGVTYNRARLGELLAVLAGWAGRRAGGDDLALAIAERERLAVALRSADELRRAERPALSGRDVMLLAAMARVVPAGEAEQLAGAVVLAAAEEAAAVRSERGATAGLPAAGLPAAGVRAAGVRAAGLPAAGAALTAREPAGAGLGAAPGAAQRLFVSGSDHDHLGSYAVLEASLGLVVGEDHGFGTSGLVAATGAGGDLFDAVLERQARELAGPARRGVSERVEAVVAAALGAGATTLVQLVAPSDEATRWELPPLATRLAGAGIGLVAARIDWPGPGAGFASALAGAPGELRCAPSANEPLAPGLPAAAARGAGNG